jgi:hypothetical protein
MALDERFQNQALTFITETIKDEIPSLIVDDDSAVNTILARGGSVITASLLQEIDNVVNSRDISDPDSLNEDELDIYLGSLLAERNPGNLSQGFVDIHFATRS